MANSFEDTPWTAPSLADFGGNVADYCAASLIDENAAGAAKVAGLCKLPYKRKADAPVNQGALRAAAGVLQGARGGVQASPAAKKSAAAKLVRLMNEAKMTPGDGLTRMAGL